MNEDRKPWEPTSHAGSPLLVEFAALPLYSVRPCMRPVRREYLQRLAQRKLSQGEAL